jgi:hypothetical protein
VNHEESTTTALKTAFSTVPATGSDSVPSHKVWKSVPVKDLRRTEFDPQKYHCEDTWKVQKQSEVNFEDFIERRRGQSTSKEKESTKQVETGTTKSNISQGNITFKESSDEEDDISETKEKLPQCQPIASAVTKDDSDYDNIDSSEDENLICVVCMDDEMDDPVILKKCRHQFCQNCIKDYFSRKPVCPVCNTVYGNMYGNQPTEGTATVYTDMTPLPGFSCPTIIINYKIPDGTQTVRCFNIFHCIAYSK